MKTLKDILAEGVVVSSDYKLSKSGKKYKAHRATMGSRVTTASDSANSEEKPRDVVQQIKDFVSRRDTPVSEEQISELSVNTLQSYINKVTSPDIVGKRGKTQTGILKSIKAINAVGTAITKKIKKQFAEEAIVSENNDNDGQKDNVDPDQHIHMQLKKAIDSTAKPYEVTFKNGKKHAVSSKVASTIMGAIEKLKPEHRKAIHDELHKSYDSLLAVHKAIVSQQ